MKSEERHELVQNDLEKLIEQTRSRYSVLIEEHGNRILLWTSAVLLLLAASIIYYRTTTTTNADGWAALMGASSPEELAGVAEAYSGTPIGEWARLRTAEQYLQNGIRLQFTDREASGVELKEAQSALETLLNQSRLTPVVRERALFAMGRVLEATSTGDLGPAITAYEKMLQEFPDSPYKPVVTEQIEQLKRKSTQEFYAWFAEQKPLLQDRDQPADFMNSFNLEELMRQSGQAPIPGSDLEMPAESAPETAPETTSEPGPSLSVPTAPEFPPTGTTPPATETPATESPASESPAPAEPAAPAETPATETPAPAPAAPATETPAAETPATESPAPTQEAPASETPAPEAPSSETPPAETDSNNGN